MLGCNKSFELDYIFIFYKVYISTFPGGVVASGERERERERAREKERERGRERKREKTVSCTLKE